MRYKGRHRAGKVVVVVTRKVAATPPNLHRVDVNPNAYTNPQLRQANAENDFFFNWEMPDE